MPWTEDKEAAFRAVLETPEADAIIDGLASVPVAQGPAADWARAQGLITADGSYTDDGYIVNDSCREFKSSLARGQTMPHIGDHPDLVADRIKGRRVVEIGAGAGMKVVALNLLGANVTGVDPVEAYMAMGRLLAAHANYPTPDLRQGTAEDIPLDDNEAEMVLCILAYNYFNIDAALTEMTRILRPGGELYLISPTFRDLPHTLMTRILSGESLKPQIILLANSLSFALMGRRILPQKPEYPTARPVYVTVGRLRRMARAAGLTPDDRVTQSTMASIFRATKPLD